MDAKDFRERLLNYFRDFERTLATENGDWVVNPTTSIKY